MTLGKGAHQNGNVDKAKAFARWEGDPKDIESILLQQCKQQLNPQQVEDLLVEELNKMTHDSRERVMEDIHGIPNPLSVEEETKLLEEMQVELDQLEREASFANKNEITACKSDPLATHTSAYQKAKLLKSELIYDRQFRWSFLHRENNHPKKAALRMFRYLDFLMQTFRDNDELLERPIFLKDLDPGALEYLQIEGGGISQILPIRDSSGRRILVHLTDAACSLLYQQQIGFYISQCLTEDRNGVVWVYFLHNTSRKFLDLQQLPMVNQLFQVLPIRFDAVHLCCPDLPMYELCKALVTLYVGKENRIRRRLHLGSYLECKYSLQQYGIGVDRLPINLETWKWSHDSDTKHFRKWLIGREAKEVAIRAAIVEMKNNKNETNKIDLRPNSNSKGNEPSVRGTKQSPLNGTMEIFRAIRKKYVECPHHEDCLFGKGNSVMNHHGNVAMRQLVAGMYQHFHDSSSKKEKQNIARDVIDRVKAGGGRFLKEDVATTGFYVEVDDDLALKKITVAFRDLKKKFSRESIKQNISGLEKRERHALSVAKHQLPPNKKFMRNSNLDESQYNRMISPLPLVVSSVSAAATTTKGNSDDQLPTSTGSIFDAKEKPSSICSCDS